MHRMEWLPELELLDTHNGDWNRYFNIIYSHFCRDFVDSKPLFRGMRLGLKRHPEYKGKSATFWHMISEGQDESERTPDLRRCERIRWPRPIIEKESSTHAIKVWTEIRGKSDERIHLWFESEGYLVVLNKRNGYILPWTAFYIEHDHQRRKTTKKWEKFNQGV